MALKKLFDTPVDITGVIASQTLNSFAFNIADSIVYIGYTNIQDDGETFQSDIPMTLQDQDYINFVNRFNLLEQSMSTTDALIQTCLEYAPGTGTIVDGVKTLDTPYDAAGTAVGQDVDSYIENVQDRLVHIGYSLLATPTTSLKADMPYSLSGTEYDDFNSRVDELGATLSGTQAIITACLEFLPGEGTIQEV